MSKAEDYIKSHTRTDSNEYQSGGYVFSGTNVVIQQKNYAPWLSLDEAREAVRMAKEEVLDEVCERLISTFKSDDYIIDGLDFYRMINDLRKAMEE